MQGDGVYIEFISLIRVKSMRKLDTHVVRCGFFALNNYGR